MSTLDHTGTTGSARAAARRVVLTRVLLLCGVAYALVYVLGNDVLVAGRFPGYAPLAQNISELAALGSPSRALALALLPVATTLMVAFGVGVWRAARGRRSLRVAGGFLVACGLVGLLSLPFPMTSRALLVAGAAVPGNDVGHIALTAVTVVLIVGMMAFAAVPFPMGFRVYAAVSALVVLVFGGLTGTQAPKLALGEPTPWMGLTERISIGAWLLWMVVLAVVLLAESRTAAEGAEAQR